MANYVRYDSENAGPFGIGNKTRIQFKVDGGMDVFDMSHSYVDLVTRFTATDADDANSVPIFRVQYEGETNALPLNSQFIQDVRLRSRNLGMLEEIRDVAFLANNLKTYMLSRDDMESIRYRNISQMENDTNYLLSSLSEFTTGIYYGSTQKSNPIRLYLGEDLMLGLGKETQMDTRYTGDLELELNTIDLTTRIVLEEVNPLSPYNLTFDDLTTADDFTSQTFTLSALELVGIGGRDPQALEINADNNPFYVDMKIELDYTTSGTTPEQRTVITTVEEVYVENNQTTGFNELKIRVRALDPADTDFTATGNLVDVDMSHSAFNPVAGGDATLTLEDAQLILKKYTMPPPVVDGMEYMTFETEGRGLADVRSVVEQFNLPKGCVNVITTMINGPSGRSNATLGESSYEYSLNALRTTSTPVSVGNGVHKDKITNTFINMGMELKNLSFSKFRAGESPDNQLGVLSVIMPEYFGERPDASSVLEFRFDKGTTTGFSYNGMRMFKQVVKRV